VRLPSVQLQQASERDGSFRFADLAPRGYLLAATAPGHAGARSAVDVLAGRATTVRILLPALATGDAFHETTAFDGFAEASDAGSVGYLMVGESMACSRCHFLLPLDGPDPESVVLEAAMGADNAPFARNGFEYYVLRADSYDTLAYDHAPNPMRLVLGAGDLAKADALDLYVSPEAFPAPEVDKAFKVFATVFHNGPAPADWSFLAQEQR
jgi:hypothetical protein